MTYIQKILAEGIGTFLLIFTIGCSEGDPFAVGGAIWCIMIFTRFISGAIFNPAVTLSIAVKKLIEKSLTASDIKLFIIFTIIQFITGIAGAFVAWKLTNFTFYYDFADDYASYKAILCEGIYTCILCINAHMVGKSSYGLYIEAFIIVITVVTGAFTIGHLTKNCLNPCIGISMDLIYYWAHGKHFENVWVYVVGPMLGGVAAAFISQFYRDLRVRNEEDLYRSSLIFSHSQHELRSVYKDYF